MSQDEPLQKPAAAPPEAGADDIDNPWADLAPDGAGLAVHDFLTTMFSHTSNGLRRAITLPYADRFELTVSEWRILSVLAHAGSLPFAELVELAAADKAQVSRALRLLGDRGLVQTQTPGPRGRKGLTCRMTEAGEALYQEIMPLARRSQAQMILTLSRDERRMLYTVLGKLRRQCGTAAADDDAVA
ncbi:MAG: winged helix-turn-helix transcriptional regulator [Hydrogenophaga sp.]|uniref:MarR family winged helix-turn-helix transcriptional regulator n=1 Tax=Hydrogenophaga sp. TaxID=1904254 RepID=UPI00261D14B2|nr:MarR family winged helix-turn-helix transcriptional regulator [Hydrogenophaga sp.]MCW5671450.1 winged helix-turn-helix transcriptional regulator [Hydrogenophaga sp.]